MMYSEIHSLLYYIIRETLDKKDYYEKEIVNAFEYIGFIINY